jgi:macrolide-specific efflux system membrane fusion protein
MGMFTAKLGPLFVWQAIVLALVTVGAGAVAYAGFANLDNPGPGVVAEDEQLVPAQIGDLINVVSTDGSLSFPNVEIASFETAGTVGQVFVKEGDSVTAGQTLATLDAASFSTLRLSLAKAEVASRDANDKLASALGPADAQAVANAQSAIAKAEVAWRDAHDKLASALEPADAQAVANAQSAIAKAEVASRDANDKLASALEPADAQAVANAQSAIAKAEVDLEKAQDDLAADLDLPQAQATVTDQQSNLADAQSSLAIVIDEWDTNVAGAQTAQIDAAGAYLEGFNRWLGVVAVALDSEASPDTNLAAIGANLAVLFPAEQNQVNFALLGSTPANDPATAWNETTVFTLRKSFLGAIVGDCGSTTLHQGTCVSTELDTLWATLKTKRNALATAQFNASKAITNGTASVTKATDDLADVRQALAALIAATDTSQVALARANEAVTQASLGAAKESLAGLREPADDIDIEVLRLQIAVAQASLDAAKESLVDLREPADDIDIEVLRLQVTVAQANLGAAKESLADLREPADDIAVEVLRLQVTAAVNELDIAIEATEGIDLLAPIAGIITEVDMFVGDAATGLQSGSMTLTDQSVIEIASTVDEIDVLSISEGVLAAISLVALPDQELRGTVTDIGAPSNNQGVVTFPVSIAVDVPADLQLREGLSATARVVISQQLGVLLVPTSAIEGSFLAPFVRVLVNGKIVERSVELGSSDDFHIIVISGLAENEKIVMPAPSTSSTELANFAFGGVNPQQFLRQIQSGGGIPGGGGNRSGNAGRGN